ncbi:hypothetical protein SAMN05421737_1021, partial [Shouchella lonarensis]
EGLFFFAQSFAPNIPQCGILRVSVLENYFTHTNLLKKRDAHGPITK